MVLQTSKCIGRKVTNRNPKNSDFNSDVSDLLLADTLQQNNYD